MLTEIVIVSVHASIEALMMLSGDVDIHKSPVCRNALQFLDNTPSSKSRAKKLNIPELPMKAKPRKGVRHGGVPPVSNFGQKSQATARYEDLFVTLKINLIKFSNFILRWGQAWRLPPCERFWSEIAGHCWV
jgi:hypothetical protein